jgi:hypothetical protein
MKVWCGPKSEIAGELEDEEFIVIVEIAKVYKSKCFAVVD